MLHVLLWSIGHMEFSHTAFFIGALMRCERSLGLQCPMIIHSVKPSHSHYSKSRDFGSHFHGVRRRSSTMPVKSFGRWASGSLVLSSRSGHLSQRMPICYWLWFPKISLSVLTSSYLGLKYSVRSRGFFHISSFCWRAGYLPIRGSCTVSRIV